MEFASDVSDAVSVCELVKFHGFFQKLLLKPKKNDQEAMTVKVKS